MVHKRKRKQVALCDRQPLIRPSRANEVWSMDFVFDRLADGRSLKCLTVVDDATHESVTITPDTAISGAYVARILERVKQERGLPKVIRSDNGREFCGRAMAIWAHENNVALRFIEPGKPNQNAYVESFNGRFARRMLERALVYEYGARAPGHRGVAPGLQRGSAQEGSGRGTAGRLRGAPEFARELRRKGIEYSLQRWTLIQTATKKGITSPMLRCRRPILAKLHQD